MIKQIFLFTFIFSLILSAQKIPKTFILEKVNNSSEILTDENPASNSITDILVVGDTIWLGTSKGLSQSIDNGTTWKNYLNTSEFGTEDIIALLYAKGVIFVSTGHSIEKNGSSFTEGSGLRFSSDNGVTWQTVSQPIDEPGDSSVVYGKNILRALPVTVAVENVIYDFAFAGNKIWVATFAGGLRSVSFDSLMVNTNAKWRRAILPPDFLSSIKPSDSLSFALQPVAGKFGKEEYLNYRLFSLVAADDSTLYAGSANGINKTTNAFLPADSISWVKFNHQNQDNPISGNFNVALGYNKFMKALFAASWKANDLNEFNAVSYSKDGGVNWNTTLHEEKAHNFASDKNSVIAVTDNGIYLNEISSLNSWLNAGSIVDKKSGLALQTTKFYSAAFSNNGNTVWAGSGDGLVKNEMPNYNWSDDWTIFYASQPLQKKDDCYAFPNPFSPKMEMAKIKYNTGGISKKVTIRILDFGMNYLRTLIQNVDRGNPAHVINSSNTDGINGVIDYWDGRDDFGNVVPNGVYFYRIEIDGQDSQFGKIMVIQ
ncbi:MAG: hypothetical protein M0P61_07210 [Ignavibacteriaceae bacterium]|jgi:hypothetical protein|nr:hypothetical protein [Ignavibacteriaceae bacterium]